MILTLLLIIAVSVATIYMVNRAIQVDNTKPILEKNLKS